MDRKNKEEEITVWDEVKGQVGKNKHHVIKVAIAILVIPSLIMLLDGYILEGTVPKMVTTLISFWATYLIISLYDSVISREAQRAKNQIVRNTLDVLVMKEDIKTLQAEVYKESKEEVRAKNLEVAMKRKGDTYLEGEIYGGKTKTYTP